jgi:hypothetical protein
MAAVSFWRDRAQRADAEPCRLDCFIFDGDGTLADTSLGRSCGGRQGGVFVGGDARD